MSKVNLEQQKLYFFFVYLIKNILIKNMLVSWHLLHTLDTALCQDISFEVHHNSYISQTI